MILQLLLLFNCYLAGAYIFKNEGQVNYFLRNVYEKNATQRCYQVSMATWDAETDLRNSQKQEKLLSVTLKSSDVDKYYWKKYFKNLKINKTWSNSTKRQLAILKDMGTSILNTTDLTKLENAISDMTDIYGSAKLCPFNKQNCRSNEKLSLEPDLVSIMANSTNLGELRYVWKGWRDVTGAKMRQQYATYVELSNKAARLNGYADMGKMWQSDYESNTFLNDVNRLWYQIRPLYRQLHKYVLRKLKRFYKGKLDFDDGLIHAHILGDMWAQEWTNIADKVRPYKKASSIKVDSEMTKQRYTPIEMFRKANEFYTSMGLMSNERSYGPDAQITKPDRDAICHATAFDFCDGHTYRIRMCTTTTLTDFITIHHEMGHIQYYQQYKHQPIAFRDGANPGFHEAIGDTIALSAATPTHLSAIGLLKNFQNTKESAINRLMDMALQKIAFLPFGLVVDKWRYDVFSGRVRFDEWNAHWWRYREYYQGLKPPVRRSESDFDPGAKYHVVSDSQYMDYFIAHVLQFQLYRALCVKAKQYDPVTKTPPLHKCDFYRSREAGSALSAGLRLGASVHWKIVLKTITGEDDLDASAILEYFAPLAQYLDTNNKIVLNRERIKSNKSSNETLEEYDDEESKNYTSPFYSDHVPEMETVMNENITSSAETAYDLTSTTESSDVYEEDENGEQTEDEDEDSTELSTSEEDQTSGSSKDRNDKMKSSTAASTNEVVERNKTSAAVTDNEDNVTVSASTEKNDETTSESTIGLIKSTENETINVRDKSHTTLASKSGSEDSTKDSRTTHRPTFNDKMKTTGSTNPTTEDLTSSEDLTSTTSSSIDTDESTEDKSAIAQTNTTENLITITFEQENTNSTEEIITSTRATSEYAETSETPMASSTETELEVGVTNATEAPNSSTTEHSGTSCVQSFHRLILLSLTYYLIIS